MNLELVYRCYALNRQHASAEQLAPWFQINGKRFEARYQEERRKK